MFDINGECWKVFLVSPEHQELMRSDGTYTIGSCNDYKKAIFINNSLNNHYMKKVLCHELTHAAMFSYNIELSLQQEELLADLIATYGQEIMNITNILFKRIKENRETF